MQIYNFIHAAFFMFFLAGMPSYSNTCASLFSISSDELSRIERTQDTIGRKLNSVQAAAVIEAHNVGYQLNGKDGQPAAINNYTFRQLLKKARILRSASFTNAEIRKVMQKSIVGLVSQAQISDAIAAELNEPSVTVSIRESGLITQYADLDNPQLFGKKILVNFILDKYNPGSDGSRYPVPQLVLTKDYLDRYSQTAAETIIAESAAPGGTFREVGVWVAYTRRGQYKSQTFTSNDPFIIENAPVIKGLDDIIREVDAAEGRGALVDIEFFHTHKEAGEAFSFGDLDFQDRYFKKTIRAVLGANGTYASYAIPVSGTVIFKSVIRKESQ